MIFGRHINRYYLRYAWLLLLGLCALILVDFAQLLVPEIYNMVINGIKEGEVVYKGDTFIFKALLGDRTHDFNMNFLLDFICLPMIAVIAALVVGRFAWRICFFGAGIRVETDLRGRMFDRCKDLSQQFYQTNKVGNMMSLFTNDLETVQDCFGMGMMMFFDALLLGGMAILKMFRMNLWLTLLTLIPMALLCTISAIMEKYLSAKWDHRQAMFSSLSDFSQESFSGIAVIKAFVKEFKELWAFKKLNKDNEDANVEYVKLSTKLRIACTLLIESVTCVILGFGGYLVYEGTFDPGQLIEYVGYFTTIVWPVMAVSELIEMKSRGDASLKRIGELLDEEPDIVDGEDAKEVDMLRGEITFKDLTFRYPGGDYDVLRNVSVTIRAGEHVGLIGKTGSGKTTLVDLILRTYNVPDGTLFLDGMDINSIALKDVRKNAAYVPQDNFLFSDTIENNIAFATDERDHELIEQAAKMADVHENITGFAAGYDTILGERGVTVSGGQKQRISIARALLKNAPILILDDSVSAVDVKTEKVILENLRSIRADRTTILIAHRISTIEKMDKVIFIDDGAIAAVGTHEELCRDCAEYRNMVELQKLEEPESEAKEGHANV